MCIFHKLINKIETRNCWFRGSGFLWDDFIKPIFKYKFNKVQLQVICLEFLFDKNTFSRDYESTSN